MMSRKLPTVSYSLYSSAIVKWQYVVQVREALVAESHACRMNNHGKRRCKLLSATHWHRQPRTTFVSLSSKL